MADLESLLEYNQIVNQMFNSEVQGFQFYNAYALKKEFSVRRSYAEWDAGHNELTLRKFVCSLLVPTNATADRPAMTPVDTKRVAGIS